LHLTLLLKNDHPEKDREPVRETASSASRGMIVAYNAFLIILGGPPDEHE
jgi:hypothetical protein